MLILAAMPGRKFVSQLGQSQTPPACHALNFEYAIDRGVMKDPSPFEYRHEVPIPTPSQMPAVYLRRWVLLHDIADLLFVVCSILLEEVEGIRLGRRVRVRLI